MSNVIALCVGFCALVLFTHLLRTGALGAPSYSTLLIVTGVIAIAIAKIDLLEILDLKNMRVEIQKGFSPKLKNCSASRRESRRSRPRAFSRRIASLDLTTRSECFGGATNWSADFWPVAPLRFD
jgi:hypothetical protein